MAIEIRELIIKTEIVSERENGYSKKQNDRLNEIRREIIEECKSLLTESRRKNINKR